MRNDRSTPPTSTCLAAVSLIALLAAGAARAESCTPGSVAGTVTMGELATNVPNRFGADCVTVDERIGDESPWGNQAAFLSHVGGVTLAMQRSSQLSAVERARLLIAARQSGVGSTLKVKLITFNDFHGTIKGGEGSSSNPGVARFATRIKELKAANPLHAVVSAGDMIGATPLVSALFLDEPTIEAVNRMQIDFNAVGNHEFDEGKDELLRLQQGGNHPTDIYSGQGLPPDLRNGSFAGARFW